MEVRRRWPREAWALGRNGQERTKMGKKARGGELRPEGDPGPRKKSLTRTSDPRWQVLYFQHIPDLGTLHSPAGERQEGWRSACTCLHP